MKVLILSHLYPNNINSTYGIFVHQQTKKLVEKGIFIKVIAPAPYSPGILHFKDKWRNYAEILSYESISGIDVYHPRYITFPRKILFELSGYSYYIGIREIVKEIYKDFRYDLIHAHVALPDGFAGSILKKKYNVPLITTIHGDDVNSVVMRNKRCRQKIVKVFQESDHIIANSKRTRKKIKDYYSDDQKISIIYNGISLNKIKKAEQNNSGDKVILTVARLQKLKGIDYAIKALAGVKELYPNFKYVIIGDGPERQNLEKLADTLGISDQIEFLGRRSNDVVMEYMSKCDLFILPSWNEAFGMVYLEALACAKPIIGCQGQGVEDIIEDGKSGLLVKPRDGIDLKEKILKLLLDDKLSYNLGLTGQERVLKQFTWENSVSHLIEVYEKVLGKNK